MLGERAIEREEIGDVSGPGFRDEVCGDGSGAVDPGGIAMYTRVTDGQAKNVGCCTDVGR